MVKQLFVTSHQAVTNAICWYKILLQFGAKLNNWCTIIEYELLNIIREKLTSVWSLNGLLNQRFTENGGLFLCKLCTRKTIYKT